MSEVENEHSNQHKDEAAEETKEKPKKRRRFRWLSVFLGILLIIAVSLQLALKYYSDVIIKRLLQEAVTLKSKGLYSLDFEEGSFSFFEQEFNIKNLTFKLNETRWQELKKSGLKRNLLYEFEVPEIELSAGSLREAWLSKSWTIEQFYIRNPKVFIRQTEIPKEENPDQDTNLFFIISGYLNEFEVTDFGLDKAFISYTDANFTNYSLREIDLDITGFKVDSTTLIKDNKPFYVEDIECSLGENDITLPNGTFLNFSSLYGSISGEQFKVNDARLLIKGDSTQLSEKTIAFNELDITGLQYGRLYFDSVFQAKDIRISKPFIDLGFINAKGSNQEFDYKVISKYLTSFMVGSIELDKSAIYAKMPGNNLAIDDFTLSLENVWFDETSWAARKKRFFVDDFELRLKNYIADLPDGIHQLKALELGLSTKRYYAYCNNVLIAPANQEIGMRQLYELEKDKLMNFYLSRIELTGLDIWRAYLQKRLRISTVRVNRPRLEVNHFTNLNTEIQELYRADSIQKIVDKMQIDSLFEEMIEIQELDSVSKDSLFLIESLLSERSDDSFHLTLNEFEDQVFMDSISAPLTNDTIPKNTSFTTYLLNYFDSAYTARNDSLRYFSSLDSINNLDRDSLLIANIVTNVNTAFGSVDIKSIDINEARFSYNECTSDTLERMSIENTNLTLNELSVSDKAYADSSRLFFSKEIEVDVERLGYFLPDSLHYISFDKLTLSNVDSLIKAEETWLRPRERNRGFIVENIDKSKGIYDVRLRSFLADRINFREIFREQRVIIETLDFEKPNVLHFVPKENTQKYDTSLVELSKPEIIGKELYLQELPIWQPTLSDYLNTFIIRSINFQQGFYSLAQVTDRTRELLSARDVQLCVRNLFFDSLALSENEILPLVDDAELLANNYFINLPDSVHTLQSKSLGLSLSSSSVYLYDIDIKPSAIGRRMNGVNKYNIVLPTFRLDGIDWSRLYFERDLYIREMLLDNPMMSVETVYAQKEAGKKDEQLQNSLEEAEVLITEKIRESVLQVLNGFEIDRMNLNRGVLDLKQIENRTIRQRLKTDRLDLAVTNFKIDSIKENSTKRFVFALDWRLNARNLIHNLPDAWHSIRTSKVEFSSAANNFYATYLHYAPKNWADMDFMKGNRERKNLTEVYTPLLSIKGTNLQKLLTENVLMIQDIHLEKPKFRLVLHPNGQRPPPNERLSTVMVDSLLRKTFREVQINQFHFEDASINLAVHPIEEESRYIDVNKVFAKVDNFNNLFQSYDSSRFMLADDIHVGIKEYNLDLPDSIYHFKVDEVGLHTGNPNIYVRGLDVKPKVSKKAIAEILGNEVDWIHLKADSIILANFNFSEFLKTNRLIAHRLDIENMNTYVYRDKRPPSPFGRRPPMPQQFLRNMQTYLKLDTVNLYNSKLTYEELATDGTQPGQIYFDDLNAYAYNITNDSVLLANGEAIQLFANAFLMGEGRVEVAFTFPIANENNSFTYQGSLEPMDLRSINPMLENVASLKVNSGISKKLTFEIQADEEYADGFMRFYYRDLNVALLKKDAKPKKQGKIKGLLTMFANVLVKSKNPRFLFLKRGRIYTERDKGKSIFNYWAKTLLSGVKHSVGFSYEKPPKERRKSVFQFWKRKRKDFRRKKKDEKPE